MKKRGHSLSHQQQHKASPTSSHDPNTLFTQGGTYSHFDQRNESPSKHDFVNPGAADKSAADEATKHRGQKQKGHHPSKSQDNAVKGKQQRQINYYSTDTVESPP